MEIDYLLLNSNYTGRKRILKHAWLFYKQLAFVDVCCIELCNVINILRRLMIIYVIIIETEIKCTLVFD